MHVCICDNLELFEETKGKMSETFQLEIASLASVVM